MTSDNIATYDDEKKKMLNDALEIFYNAKNKKYRKDGSLIHLEYELNDKKYVLTYHKGKGVITNG